MFLWGLCFDPVAWIAANAAGCESRLFVDDLEGETRGPAQTVLLYLALLCATKIAGLVVEDHHCVTLRGPNHAHARHLLKQFPVKVHLQGDGGFLIEEGPTSIYAAILRASGGWREEELVITARRCRCKTKHALVPAGEHALWAEALRGSPLAAATVDNVRFLGGVSS